MVAYVFKEEKVRFLFLMEFYLFLAELGLRCSVWAFLLLQWVGLLASCGARASH